MARVRDRPRTHIEVEDRHAIRILVRDEQILAGRIKLKMPRRFSSRMKVPHVGDPTPRPDAKNGNRLMAPVTHHHETARLVDTNTATGVHSSGESGGNRGDGLQETQ